MDAYVEICIGRIDSTRVLSVPASIRRAPYLSIASGNSLETVSVVAVGRYCIVFRFPKTAPGIGKDSKRRIIVACPVKSDIGNRNKSYRAGVEIHLCTIDSVSYGSRKRGIGGKSVVLSDVESPFRAFCIPVYK